MEQEIITLAIQAITNEIGKNPNNANLYKERGRFRKMNGDEKGAIEDLKESIKINPGILNEIEGKFHNK